MPPKSSPSEGNGSFSSESLEILTDLLQERYIKGPSGSIAEGKVNRDNREEVRAAVTMVLNDQFAAMLLAVTPKGENLDMDQLDMFSLATEKYLSHGPGLHAINAFYMHADDVDFLSAQLSEVFKGILNVINFSFEKRRNSPKPKPSTEVDGTTARVRRRSRRSGLALDPHTLDMLGGRGGNPSLGRELNRIRYEKDDE